MIIFGGNGLSHIPTLHHHDIFPPDGNMSGNMTGVNSLATQYYPHHAINQFIIMEYLSFFLAILCRIAVWICAWLVALRRLWQMLLSTLTSSYTGLDFNNGQFSERCDVYGSFFNSDVIRIIFWKGFTSPSLRLFFLTIRNDYFSIIFSFWGPIILRLFTICPPISIIHTPAR